MDKEERIVKDTQSLHSDMQTLVYENYNKFISATDTIRKMKNDFKQMEAEMDSLGKNMDSITLFSGQISNTLHDTRQQIAKLSATHSLLERLQFLFKLPNKLKMLIEENNYSQAVEDYIQTRQVLDHYAHLESFSGIRTDCLTIVDQLKNKLHEQFKSKKATTKELIESVELLLQLGEPAQSLYSQYLEHAASSLHDHLFILESETGDDLVDYVNMANKGFLCELCLVVTSYKNVFISSPAHGTSHEDTEDASRRLNDFVFEQMGKFLDRIRDQVIGEHERCDMPILVQALDIFYSKLCALTALFNDNQFAMRGIQLIIEVGEKQAVSQRQTLEEKLSDQIRGVRESVAQGKSDIGELSAGLILNIFESIKATLGHFTLFIQPELSFALDKNFVTKFSIDSMRNTLVVGFIRHIIATTTSFTKRQTTPSFSTFLILANLCVEFSSTHINHLLGLVDEWFNTKPSAQRNAQKEELCKDMHAGAQELVNHYVRMQGNTISKFIRKSIETRDWATGTEPRTVRSAMKRVMEELAASDSAVGSLFEEGTQPTEPGSGSRHHHHRSVGTSVWSPSTSHSYTHNLNKIFSDKIEIFSPVELTKASVLTGVIKIGLKTFLECVRLKTFSKYGLQQIQIDVHYLQLYLWRYVTDEKIVQLLLDEILSSVVHRCTNPSLLEPSVVELLCERA